MAAIHLISSENGDWEALYVNGQCQVQNHRLSARQVLSVLAEIVPDMDRPICREKDQDWFDKHGGYAPDFLHKEEMEDGNAQGILVPGM